jgi:dipeptidyl aminopeptidase/acylaminoacyl peptidase
MFLKMNIKMTSIFPLNVIMRMVGVLLCIYLFFGSNDITAQDYKRMSPDVYKIWSKIRSTEISDSGNTVIYVLEREEGNKILKIYDAETGIDTTFERSENPKTDASGAYVSFKRTADWDEVRKLKRLKTDNDKMPGDSLAIYDVRRQSLELIAGLEHFKMPSKYGGYVAAGIKQSNKKDEKTGEEGKKGNGKSEKEQAYSLLILDLYNGKRETISDVYEYLFCEENKKIAYVRKSKDSLITNGIFIKDLETDSSVLVLETSSKILHISFDKFGDQLAFSLESDSVKSEPKPVTLFHYTTSTTHLQKIADDTSSFLPVGWILSGNARPVFSDSGQRLFFGCAPRPLVRDTSLLDDEIVQVEIWHYDDPKLYTMAKANLEKDKIRSYRYFMDMADNTVHRVEDQRFDRSLISLKNDGRYAVLTDETPYLKSVTWEGSTLKDIYLLDLRTGNKSEIAPGQTDYPLFSPGGNYVYWYNRSDSLWKAFDIRNNRLLHLATQNRPTIWDELNDVPESPGSYGSAGWSYDDRQFLFYDRYDIWVTDPAYPAQSSRLTEGRASATRYRYIHTDPEVEYIDLNADLLIHLHNEHDKSEHYIKWNYGVGVIDTLFGGSYAISRNITKARKSDALVFFFQNFEIFPDLRYTDLSFKDIRKISNANPQQSEYGWGSAQLFNWTGYDGTQRSGMLFFPPEFNPEHSYPLIVNFYERSSDDLHRHRAPEAHRSTINYSYYTNNGYVIFNPDIRYTIGYPGQSAYDAVMSGVDALLLKGYIDSTRMGIQGHSWGGYQIAYMLTKTDRFKCAESGAPVVNMVSAYGGIRWESGMSRMFQYEKTQSRIGESLWDNPVLYFENSPIFTMYKVKTPVLILHNDEDGAVPWYQGIEYYMALRRLGKPCWLLNYNKEPHWPVKWQNRLDFNIRMQQFFDHYLMNKPIPLWMKEGVSPVEKTILKKYEPAGEDE